MFPLVKGHTLVIPKKETDYIFDIDDEVLSQMMVFAKKVAHAMGKTIPCIKVGMSVIGLEVPHAHIHLIPMQAVSDMNFSKQKLQFSLYSVYNQLNRPRIYHFDITINNIKWFT